MSERERSPAAGRDLLRTLGPTLVLAALGGWAYLDLKTDLAEVRARQEVAEEERRRAPAPAEEPPAERGDAPGPGPRPPEVATSAHGFECEGSLTEEQVREVVGARGREVLQCIEAATSRDAGLGGVLLVEARVVASGAVDGVILRGVEDDELSTCVSGVVREWVFPPPSDGSCAVVAAPFIVGEAPGRD